MAHPKDNEPRPGARQGRVTPTASAVLGDGSLVELVYEPKSRRTSLAVWRDETCNLVPSIELRPDAPRLATRFFVRVVHLPDGAQPDTVPEQFLLKALSK